MPHVTSPTDQRSGNFSNLDFILRALAAPGGSPANGPKAPDVISAEPVAGNHPVLAKRFFREPPFAKFRLKPMSCGATAVVSPIDIRPL